MDELKVKWDQSSTLTFKARKNRDKKNVLTRMTKELSVGPFSLLLRSLRDHLKVRVWTRSFNHVRGVCTGYVVAYDKHFNMAMCDVDEVYRNPKFLFRTKSFAPKKKKKKKKKKVSEGKTSDVIKTNTSKHSSQNDSEQSEKDTEQHSSIKLSSSKLAFSQLTLNDHENEVEFTPDYEDDVMSDCGETSVNRNNNASANSSESEEGNSQNQLKLFSNLQSKHSTFSHQDNNYDTKNSAIFLNTNNNAGDSSSSEDGDNENAQQRQKSHIKSSATKTHKQKISSRVVHITQESERSVEFLSTATEDEELPDDEDALASLLSSLQNELLELPSTQSESEFDSENQSDAANANSNYNDPAESDSVELEEKLRENTGKSSTTDLRQKLLKRQVSRQENVKSRDQYRLSGSDAENRGDFTKLTSKKESGTPPIDLRQKIEMKRADSSDGATNVKPASEPTSKLQNIRRFSGGKESASKSKTKSRKEDEDLLLKTSEKYSKRRSSYEDVRCSSRECKKTREVSRDKTRERSREKRLSSIERSDYWSERSSRVKVYRERSRESRERVLGRVASPRKSDRKVTHSQTNIHYEKGNESKIKSISLSHESSPERGREKDKLEQSSIRRQSSNEQKHRDKSHLSKPYRSYDSNLTGSCGLNFGDEEVLSRHVNQLFIRGDNVVMIALVQ